MRFPCIVLMPRDSAQTWASRVRDCLAILPRQPSSVSRFTGEFIVYPSVEISLSFVNTRFPTFHFSNNGQTVVVSSSFWLRCWKVVGIIFHFPAFNLIQSSFHYFSPSTMMALSKGTRLTPFSEFAYKERLIRSFPPFLSLIFIKIESLHAVSFSS